MISMPPVLNMPLVLPSVMVSVIICIIMWRWRRISRVGVICVGRRAIPSWGAIRVTGITRII